MTQFIKSNMETNINIAEILKDKPQGTKLYSPLFGNVYLLGVEDGIIRASHHGKNETLATFYRNGKYFSYPESEPLLFPSKEMNDWSKLVWKKGDVLVSNNCDSHIIFNGFSSVDYTKFEGKHWVSISKKRYISCLTENTQDYHIENNKEAAQTYINTIERKLGGKLNLETLEIEKQLEFKDGDIIVTDAIPDECYSKCIFILKGDLNTDECHANSYVFYNVNNNHISFNITDRNIRDRNIHLATDSEKQQLFSVLAKEGKAWDAEKKQIVDLKSKIKLKPFDKVLVRDHLSDNWRANLFSHIDKNGEYYCIWASWNYCIPYKDNEHLLGTTNDPK